MEGDDEGRDVSGKHPLNVCALTRTIALMAHQWTRVNVLRLGLSQEISRTSYLRMKISIRRIIAGTTRPLLQRLHLEAEFKGFF
jgi:hypothetical protein